MSQGREDIANLFGDDCHCIMEIDVQSAYIVYQIESSEI